jgi:hypothetical protein
LWHTTHVWLVKLMVKLRPWKRVCHLNKGGGSMNKQHNTLLCRRFYSSCHSKKLSQLISNNSKYLRKFHIKHSCLSNIMILFGNQTGKFVSTGARNSYPYEIWSLISHTWYKKRSTPWARWTHRGGAVSRWGE